MERLKGMTVLVTGGSGLVGGHIVEALLKRGARVVVTERSVSPYSYFETEKLRESITVAYADLKDKDRIFEIVVKYEIDAIVHVGAQAIVTTAYDNPYETLCSNIMGTAHILEAARQYKRVKSVVVASSDKAYGKGGNEYKESDPLLGDHPYEVSKSCTDLIAIAYAKTYNLPITVARFGNIYGPGDLNFTRIIPAIMKSLITKNTLVLRSDGTYVRDYVYVGDVVSGYLFLLTNIEKTRGQSYNLSSRECLSVLECIQKAETVLHKKIPFTIENSAINEIPWQHLNIGKIQKLGWEPKYSLSYGLPLTYAWYRQNKELLFSHI